MNLRCTPAVAAAFAAALVLAACTSQVEGQATPSSTPTSSASSTPPSDPANPFAGLSACKILDQAMSGLGLPAATPTVAYPGISCAISTNTSGNTPGTDLALSLQAGRKYDANINNPSKASTGFVNGRPSIEEREPLTISGQCGINIEVKPSSQAVIVFSSGSDTERACKTIEGYAAKIEPLLPKTS